MSATAPTEGMAEIAAGWRSAWQLLIGVGALLAVLGLVAIIYPAAATATINIMAGIFLIIAGVLLFGFAFAAREAGDVIIWIAIGVLAIIVGIVFLSAPDIGTVTLTVILAVWFILSGLAKLAAAYEQRGRTGVGLVAINGVISLILGALIAAELPDAADWAIGLLLGIMFLVDGLVMIVLGLVAAATSASVTFTVILAVWFILSGLAKLAAAYEQRGRTGVGLVAINGVISLILGALIAAELPDAADWAIGLLLGIMFLVDGLVMIALGWSLRRAGMTAADSVA